MNGSHGELVFMNGSHWEFSVVNGSNWESGIFGPESELVSDISDGLEFAIGVNVLVTSGFLTETVSDFVFGRRPVGITVLGVAEFILKKKNNQILNMGIYFLVLGNTEIRIFEFVFL